MKLRHGGSVFPTPHGARPSVALLLLGITLGGCGQSAVTGGPEVVAARESEQDPAQPGGSTAFRAVSDDDPRDDHFAPVSEQAFGPNDAARLGTSVSATSALRLGHRRTLVAFADRGAGAVDALSPVTLGFAHSDDGGEHWTRGALGPASQLVTQLGEPVGEPTIAASRPQSLDGETSSSVYYASVFTLTGIDPQHARAVAIARSVDGGETFGAADVAAMPGPFTPFGTADSPSIAVDDGGVVHLVFVADQGTERAAVQYWLGRPGPDQCGATCMTWRQGPSPWLHTERQAAMIRHPMVRTFRRLVYLAYEVREPARVAEPGHADGEWILEAARLNAYTFAWEPMDEAPAGGGWMRYHTHTRSTGGFAPAEVTSLFDFAIDQASGVGTFAWVADSSRDGSGGDAVSARSFEIVHALREIWSPPVPLSDPPGASEGNDFAPTLAAGAQVRAATWFRQEASTGRVRLMGAQSLDAGATWLPARNITAVAGRARDASMPACGDAEHPWRGLATTTLVPRGDARLVPLTVHFDTGAGECPAADAPPGDWTATLAATRWRPAATAPALGEHLLYP